jgi:transmembrane protein TMEM174 (potassium channel)
MTLLVLDHRIPSINTTHAEHDLWRALVALAPQLVIYLMGFMIMLVISWITQQAQVLITLPAHTSRVLLLAAARVSNRESPDFRATNPADPLSARFLFRSAPVPRSHDDKVSTTT